MKKKLLILLPLVGTLLTALGVAPSEASVGSGYKGGVYVTTGYPNGTRLKSHDALWTKSYCQAGRHTHTWAIQKHPQAKLVTYIRGGHVCAFVSFPAAHRHELTVAFGDGTYQQGMYRSYAGAIAAPRGACRRVLGALSTSTGSYYAGAAGGFHRICG